MLRDPEEVMKNAEKSSEEEFYELSDEKGHN